jgi:hypothetical protein
MSYCRTVALRNRREAVRPLKQSVVKHVCMYVFSKYLICMYVCMYVCMHVCMYVYMCVDLYVCMYVCMYMCKTYQCCAGSVGSELCSN